MSNETHRQNLLADRKALDDYFKSPMNKPLIIKRRHSEYCSCEVILPTATERLKTAYRATMVWLAARFPWSCTKVFFYKRAGMKIGKGVFISWDVAIDPLFPQLITLEEESMLGIGSRLMAHEYAIDYFRIAPVRVCKNAVVGAYSTVRSGCTIGQSAMVSCHSYVNRSVPPGASVRGVPAKVLVRRKLGSDGFPI